MKKEITFSERRKMKALIFDVDNTLIELRSEYVLSVKKVLEDMNYNFSDDVINDIYINMQTNMKIILKK